VSDAYLIRDKVTHHSRGYGFVNMENDEDAHRAIEGLNESTYNGRQLHVTVAKVSATPEDKEE
jgi:RNA recognition motif-containing protein